MTGVVGSDRAAVKRLAALAWAVAVVSAAGFAVAWVLAARNRDLLGLSANFGPDRFLVAYAVVGGVVASRRPSNAIGWFLLGIGLVTACRGLAGEYALYALAGSARPAAGVWAAWFVNWSLTLLFPGGLVTFLLLLFPNGRPVTARWWAVGWAGVGMGVFILLANWFHPGPVAVYGLPSVPNPTGIRGFISLTWGSWLFEAANDLSWVCLLVAAASVFVRYRRSASEERLQVTWFAYAAVLSLALLVALLPLTVAIASGQLLFGVVLVAGIGLALPLSVGIAILKYRLYAIDKIISRTVSYALVTGLVAGVYLGCVALLTKILPFRGQRRHRGRGPGRGRGVQPAAPASAGHGRPAVRPGPLRRRTRGRAVFRPAAGTGRSRAAGQRPARRGESRPGSGARDTVAQPGGPARRQCRTGHLEHPRDSRPAQILSGSVRRHREKHTP